MVLRSRAQHRGPADVDVFDCVGNRAALLGYRSFKRIQIDDDQVDHSDSVFRRLRHVRGIGTQAEQPAVNLRVEGLDAPVHHFGKSRIVGNLRDGDSLLRQELGSPARREDCVAVFANQISRKFHDACFIAYVY